MCTLTYIPFEDGFIFTHNRDEDRARPTSSEIHQSKLDAALIVHPKDLRAQGTWMASAQGGRTICLLNGGKHPYLRKPPYRHSRGLVTIDYFSFKGVEEFFSNYNFSDLEPFTLIIREPQGLFKITHDLTGNSLQPLNKDRKGIWSSTTLYTEEVRKKREAWFEKWLSQDPALTPEAIRKFHLSAGDGDQENDLVMSRWGIVETQSITQAVYLSKHSLYYLDIQKNGTSSFVFPENNLRK